MEELSLIAESQDIHLIVWVFSPMAATETLQAHVKRQVSQPCADLLNAHLPPITIPWNIPLIQANLARNVILTASVPHLSLTHLSLICSRTLTIQVAELGSSGCKGPHLEVGETL